jgi:acylphosphatase
MSWLDARVNSGSSFRTIDNHDFDPSMIARRCWVSGRVQGVYYRASARQQAVRLGVNGYARNLPDGRVEVLMVGSAAAAQSLLDWLWQGPPSASVTHVEVEELPLAELAPLPTSFAIQ